MPGGDGQIALHEVLDALHKRPRGKGVDVSADHEAANRLSEQELQKRFIGQLQLAVPEVDPGELALDEDHLLFELNPTLRLGVAMVAVSLVPPQPLMVGEW